MCVKGQRRLRVEVASAQVSIVESKAPPNPLQTRTGASVARFPFARAAFMRRPPAVNTFLVEPVLGSSKHDTAWLSFALDEGRYRGPGADGRLIQSERQYG